MTWKQTHKRTDGRAIASTVRLRGRFNPFDRPRSRTRGRSKALNAAARFHMQLRYMQVHQWLNELRGIASEGPRGPELTRKVRKFFDDLRSRYGLRVIGQRPCTKVYSHYVAELSRLPQWDRLGHCSEHCSKCVISTTITRSRPEMVDDMSRTRV